MQAIIKALQHLLVVGGMNMVASSICALFAFLIAEHFTTDAQVFRFAFAVVFFSCFVLFIRPLINSVRRIRGEAPLKRWSL